MKMLRIRSSMTILGLGVLCGLGLLAGPSFGEAAGAGESLLRCDALPFVENVFWTSDYGPAAADVLSAPTNMVPCTRGTYALCYYAGAPGMTCKVDEVKGVASCECVKLLASKDEPYFVDVNAILNTCVYIETVVACGVDGSGCLEPDSAPVCQYIARQRLNPKSDLISTFSFKSVGPFERGCQECSEGVYAGCMTAPCWPKDAEIGSNVTCVCPLARGPYQFGRAGDYTCDAGEGLVWSAAYNVAGCNTPTLPKE